LYAKQPRHQAKQLHIVPSQFLHCLTPSALEGMIWSGKPQLVSMPMLAGVSMQQLKPEMQVTAPALKLQRWQQRIKDNPLDLYVANRRVVHTRNWLIRVRISRDIKPCMLDNAVVVFFVLNVLTG